MSKPTTPDMIEDLKACLSLLKDKGYTRVGICEEDFRAFDILMIHPDWTSKNWSFTTSFDKAFADLREVGVADKFLITIEAVALDMYLNEREGGPAHVTVFDLAESK